MKKYLLTWALITITATTLYATTAGSTVVDAMKAASHAFTLATNLNPGQTGLTSEPVKGKKTGDILTAGEYNRLLELVSEGGGGAGGNPVYFTALHTAAQTIPANAIWNAQGTLVAQYTDSNGAVNKTSGLFTAPVSGYYYLNGHAHYFTTPDANSFVQFIGGGGTKSVWWNRSAGSDKPMNEVNTVWYLNAGETVGLYLWNDKPSTNVYARFTGILINGWGNAGASGSGWVDVPLSDTNPFDQQCMYRFVMQGQTYYAETVHEDRLYWINVMYFAKANKSVLVGGIAPFTIATKIEKLCGGGGGGSTSATCPSGFVAVGSFCIEPTMGPVNKTWYEAAGACADKGAQLCSWSEWAVACKKGILTDVQFGTTNGKYEWIDDYTGDAYQGIADPRVYGDCEYLSRAAPKTPNATTAYRCCSPKQ